MSTTDQEQYPRTSVMADNTIVFEALLEKAKAIATKCHEGQVRKYTNAPYTTHLESVATILECLKGVDDDFLDVYPLPLLQTIAWLHDVMEDTDFYTWEGLESELLSALDDFPLSSFWQRNLLQHRVNFVMSAVRDLTDVSVKGNRAYRKKVNSVRWEKCSELSKAVKLADLIDNCSSVVEHDPDFAKLYLLEKTVLLQYLIGGPPFLFFRALRVISQGLETLHFPVQKVKLPPATTVGPQQLPILQQERLR